jgi:hypothetical protein
VTPIQEGQVGAVIAQLFGLWWLNVSRTRVRRGREEAGPAVRLRLRHAARTRRVGRGAVRRLRDAVLGVVAVFLGDEPGRFVAEVEVAKDD